MALVGEKLMSLVLEVAGGLISLGQRMASASLNGPEKVGKGWTGKDHLSFMPC